MTAVMRAVRTQPLPKVLRVGMLVEGRIVEERIVKETFALEGASFERTKTGYRLAYASGVTGRIAIGASITDLRGEGSTIALPDDARGKIVLGRVTLLFQLVDQPPATSRPQLPLAVQTGNAIDWRLTIIAALSFLMHFGFVGAMYSDWTDGVADESVDIASLVDLSRTMPATVPLETTAEHPTTTSNTTHNTSSSQNSTSTASNNSSSSNANARAAALSRQAEAMQMDLLAAFGGESAVDNALRRSNLPVFNLDDVAKMNGGVRPGEDLKLATNGGLTIQPGDDHDLSRLGVTTVGPNHKVIAQDVRGPETTIDTSIKDPIGNLPIRNLEASIAKLRPNFRSCYNKGIQSQPDMQGKVVFRVKLAPNGEVISVDKIDGSGLSDGVEQCAAKAIKRGDFDGPGGSGSQFDVPVSFLTQKR